MPEDEGGAPAVETAPAGESGGGVTEPVVETDPFDDAKVEQFDRPYVERLRNEAAKYRTDHKPFKEAFDGFSEEDRGVLLETVALIASDPQAGAERLRELAGMLSPAEMQEVLDEAEGQEEAPQYLTPEQLQEAFNKRDQEEQLRKATEDIKAEAKELGYEEGTPSYRDLLLRAQYDHNYDLKAAHEAIEKDKQAIIDSYVKSKGGAPIATGQGQTTRETSPIRTFADAKESARARAQAAAAQ